MTEIDDAADRLIEKLMEGLSQGCGVSAHVLGSIEPVAVIEAKSVGRLIELRTTAGATIYIREAALLGIVVTAEHHSDAEEVPFQLDDGTEIVTHPG